MMKNILATTALVLTCTASSNAATIGLSDFFQDWTLDSYSSSGQCASTISSIPGDTIPGTQGIPGPDYDASKTIRFRYDRDLSTENEKVLTLGKSSDSTVSLSGNVLSVSSKKHVLFFSKTSVSQTFTLGQDGGLLISSGSAKCSYKNTHPELAGKVEIGASLIIGGVKVAECTFVPASPRPDQSNFVYTEACDLGKYTDKTTVDPYGVAVKEEVAANSLAPHDLVIVRSSDKLNAGTENWLSIDGEILAQDFPGMSLPPVDDFKPNKSEYFISPYETSQYTISATNGVVQIQYSNP
jgi:hypothetical protein